MTTPEAGSSPPVRGTRAEAQGKLEALRFIPACAGNTRTRSRKRWLRAVHPRLCGEHGSILGAAALGAGSSPPVRGTPQRRNRPGARCRFIPACAGNTARTRPPSWANTVHPRLCGEHQALQFRGVDGYGSSPPVRGTRKWRRRRQPRLRFIPACAGNTSVSWNGYAITTVHPRLCGEHAARNVPRSASTGSSPPVRGTLLPLLQDNNFGRFIPACAGNTQSRAAPGPFIAVHPRLCGEHLG